MIPGIILTFSNAPAYYDFTRDIVTFTGDALGEPVKCAISREALADHFGADGLAPKGRIEKFLENRSAIERLACTKFLDWPIEDIDMVVIKTADVLELLKEDPEHSDHA